MTRKRVLALAAVVVVVAVVVVFVLPMLDKRSGNPEWEADLAAAKQFVQQHEKDLIELARRLEALGEMVAKEDWLPADEQTASVEQDDLLLLWAHDLKGEDPPELAKPLSGLYSSELETIEPMLEWAAEPSALPETYDGSKRSELEDRLKRANPRYLAVAELRETVLPEITDLDLGSEDETMGHFRPGRATFAVAVIDMESMKIVASGRGEATNADEVRAIDSPRADLWQRTRTAAQALAERLTGQTP